MRKPPSTRTPRSEAVDAELAQAVSQCVQQAVLQGIVGAGAAADRVALVIARATVPLAAVALARSHPGGSRVRQQMQAIYERCLAHYRDAVRPQDAARGIDDVGAAVAHFVAANLHVLHGSAVTPQVLAKLELQLAGVVRLTSAWASATARERQLYFEKMALLSVFVGESFAQALSQGEAAVENVRRAARAYLRELLGIDPDALTLGADGLAVRVVADERRDSAHAAVAG